MDAPSELILAVVDDVFAWRKRKPGLTLRGARLGRLVVSSRRLMFLAVDGSEGQAPVPGGAIVMAQTRTDALGLTALDRDGSLAARLEAVVEWRVARRWDGAGYFTARIADSDGTRSDHAFMGRYGGPHAELERLSAALEKARRDRLTNPYRA